MSTHRRPDGECGVHLCRDARGSAGGRASTSRVGFRRLSSAVTRSSTRLRSGLEARAPLAWKRAAEDGHVGLHARRLGWRDATINALFPSGQQWAAPRAWSDRCAETERFNDRRPASARSYLLDCFNVNDHGPEDASAHRLLRARATADREAECSLSATGVVSEAGCAGCAARCRSARWLHRVSMSVSARAPARCQDVQRGCPGRRGS